MGNNYHIHTTLKLTPADFGHVHCYSTVMRGASAEFLFDFAKYSYLKSSWGEPWYQYIEQMTFVFKQKDETPIYFNLFKHRKSDWVDPVEDELEDHFAYDADRDCISLLISGKETAQWNLASKEEPVEFEIAIDADTYMSQIHHKILKQGADAIIIEKQDPIIVVDSLYREIMPQGDD